MSDPAMPARLLRAAPEPSATEAAACSTCKDGDGVVWVSLPDGGEEARQCPECRARARRRSVASSPEEARTLAERVGQLERRLGVLEEALALLLPSEPERLAAVRRELASKPRR